MPSTFSGSKLNISWIVYVCKGCCTLALFSDNSYWYMAGFIVIPANPMYSTSNCCFVAVSSSVKLLWLNKENHTYMHIICSDRSWKSSLCASIQVCFQECQRNRWILFKTLRSIGSVLLHKFFPSQFVKLFCCFDIRRRSFQIKNNNVTSNLKQKWLPCEEVIQT